MRKVSRRKALALGGVGLVGLVGLVGGIAWKVKEISDFLYPKTLPDSFFTENSLRRRVVENMDQEGKRSFEILVGEVTSINYIDWKNLPEVVRKCYNQEKSSLLEYIEDPFLERSADIASEDNSRFLWIKLKRRDNQRELNIYLYDTNLTSLREVYSKIVLGDLLETIKGNTSIGGKYFGKVNPRENWIYENTSIGVRGANAVCIFDKDYNLK